jgi:hypothetical protein
MRSILSPSRLASTKALDAMLATTIDHDWDRAEQRYAEIICTLPANLEARVGSAINHGMCRRFLHGGESLRRQAKRLPHNAASRRCPGSGAANRSRAPYTLRSTVLDKHRNEYYSGRDPGRVYD